MARFSIIDASTGNVKYSGTPRYNGTYCKVSYLEFPEIASPTPIDWKVGDYVVYSRTGLTYKLYDIPQPRKRSRGNKYGGAFVYSNVQFFAGTKQLELTPFRDVVLADNAIHFTSQASWSVWTNVEGLIQRLQAVMDELYPNQWVFRLVTVQDHTSPLYILLHDNFQDYQISGDSVLAGLEKIYEQWENIGWRHSVESGKNVITIGYPAVRISGIGTDSEEFSYGKGNGLLSIKKNQANRDDLKTRIYVYGSTRNIPTRYYNNLTPAIKDNDSVFIPNLMLPVSTWGTTAGKRDAAKAFLENTDASEIFGLRPAAVYFDGDEEDEIYPSISNTTIEMLREVMSSEEQYYPSSSWEDSARLDEVVSASGITDDGVVSVDGERYQRSESLATTAFSGSFPIADTAIDLHIISNHTAGATGRISIDLSDLAASMEDVGVIKSITAYLAIQTGTVISTFPIEVVESRYDYIFKLPVINGVAVTAGQSIDVWIKGNITVYEAASGGIPYSVSSVAVKVNYSYSIAEYFTLRIPQIGFDIAKRSALGTAGLATISMKDGDCGGREFIVAAVKYDSESDSWDLKVARGDDESLGIRFPNTTYQIKAGDHFVLLDIAMPDSYVGMAEQKLLEAGEKYLADISHIKPFYEPEIDAEFMVENDCVLREGMYFKISDEDIIGESPEYVLIDTLTINEGERNIPTYKVTLREQKRVNHLSYAGSPSVRMITIQKGDGTVTTYAETKGGAPIGGGISSVGLSMPAAFSVVGSPLTSAGTIEVLMRSGYAIPTTFDIENIRLLASLFGYDEEHNAVYVKNGGDSDRSFYAFGQVSAGGIGSGGGGGGTTVSWDDKGSQYGNLFIEGVSVASLSKHGHTHSQYMLANLKGAANGVAELDTAGKIPTSQLPSYVSDVVEKASKSQFPETGEANKIYIAKDTNLTYRWTGSAYAEISPSIALGETSETAYRGDRGKIAYDHSQITSGNPHGVTFANIGGTLAASKITSGTFGTERISDKAITLAKLSDTVQDSLALADSALQSHQAIYALTIQKNGTTLGTYTPNSAAKTINISDVASAATLSALSSKLDDLFTKESYTEGGVTKYRIKANYGLYSETFISAGGFSSGGGGGGSIVSWNQLATSGTKIATISIDGVSTDVYAPATATWENISGKPPWIGDSKPSYAFSEITGIASASQIPSLDWSKITTGKPTTLSGYGITDAKIVNGVITLGSNTITPLTSHQSLAGLGASLGAASNALTLKNQSGTVLSTITAANLVTVLGNTAVNRAIADGDGNNIVNTYVNKSTPLFGNSYRRVEFTGFSIGTPYANLDDRYKDGTYHRMWRIRFPNPATSAFWGKIIVTVNGGYNNFNASGVLQKTINVAINPNTGTTEDYIYNNGGYYSGLGVNVEKDFRISEMVWNTEAACWEILIKSIRLYGNNCPTVVILEFISGETNSSAQYERFVNPVAVLTAELNNDATYKKGGGGVISWLDQPVLQHPYGYDMYHSGNFVAGTDYPSLTGAGASGTWGINISGNAASATKLATARNIWGQSFDGTAAISGDMSSVGKITFTAKSSKATSGNVLEVVTINGVNYLHTTLPFFSDESVSAGGIGTGGGGGTDVSWSDGDANYGVLTIAGNAHNVSILGHTHQQYMLASAKGAANGVAELGSDSKIPMSQLPDIVMGQLLYGGTVNASNVATLSANVKTKLGISSSTVTLTNGTGTYGYTKFEGVYFIMSADSSFASLDLKVGDWLISTGTAWKKIDNTDAVTGVKGQNQTSYQIGNVNISWDNVKPSAGVAKAELASGVQTSLGLADGALQKERFNVLPKQSGSSLATCDDLIGTCGIFRMGSKADSETPDAGGYGNLLSMFVPNTDTYAQIYLGYYNDASRNIFFRSGRSDLTSEAHRTWHHVIHDGNTSEITTVGTITSGVWHGTAIAKAYLASDVQTSLGKADTAYQKASTGIPKTDLASAVQDSLGKADSALQAHQAIYAATFSAGTFSAKTYNPKSAAQTINIPTTTSHISEGTNLYFTNQRAIDACAGTYYARLRNRTHTYTGPGTGRALLALAYKSAGYPQFTDPVFKSGKNNVTNYGSDTVTRVTVSSEGIYSPGTESDYVLKVVHNDIQSTGNYGFTQPCNARPNGVMIHLFRALVPTSLRMETANNNIGTGGRINWLTDNVGTGKWEWYAYEVDCGETGEFSTFGFIRFRPTGSETGSATVYIAYANVIKLSQGEYDGWRTRYSDNASKLTVDAGSASQPVYFTDGVPAVCSSIEVSGTIRSGKDGYGVLLKNSNEIQGMNGSINGNLYMQNDAGNLYVCRGGGKVCIGTNDPHATLDVLSPDFYAVTIRRNNANNGAMIRFENTNTSTPKLAAFGYYKATGYSEFRWYQYTASQSTETIATLTSTGNFTAIGQVTAGAASDLRFKKNIESMSRVNAESILAGLRPVEFDWNELGTELSGNKGHDTGLIAQEVLGVFPYAVSPIYERYLRVDYAKLTPILVAGWQSHETRIEKLERENMELREEIKRLSS